MNNEICLICLGIKINEKLLSLNEYDSSNVCLKEKLQNCIPEVEWNKDYTVCLKCSEQLECAYDFRQSCMKLEAERIQKWEELVNVKTEYGECDATTEHSQHYKSDAPLEIEVENIANNFTCFQCNKSFASKTNLGRHLKNKCKSKKKFNCKTCGEEFLEENTLQNHVEVCNTQNSTVEIGENGNKDASNSNSVKTIDRCEICGTVFSNKYLLKRHKKNVHATEKKFKCDICPSSFVSIVYLNAHKKYHSGDRKYVCSFCGKGFITASDLYHHEKNHENKRAYKCVECNKAFNTTSHLYKHKICVHQDRKFWKYSCNVCERKFPLKVNLDTHIKMHTGEKNFACRLCGKKYVSQSALTRHMDSHANASFKCTLCNLAYRYPKSLSIHMLENHGLGEGKIPERTKSHTCNICSRSCYSNSKLQKHLRTHTGDRPFKCPQCEKCFIDKSYIKQHLISAHEFKNEY